MGHPQADRGELADPLFLEEAPLPDGAELYTQPYLMAAECGKAVNGSVLRCCQAVRHYPPEGTGRKFYQNEYYVFYFRGEKNDELVRN